MVWGKMRLIRKRRMRQSGAKARRDPSRVSRLVRRCGHVGSDDVHRARSWHRQSGSRRRPPPGTISSSWRATVACSRIFIVVDDKRNDGRVSAIPSEPLRLATDETALGLKHEARNAKARRISISSSVWGGTTKNVSKIQIKDSMGAHM